MFSSFFSRTGFLRTVLVSGLAAVSSFSAPAAIAADTYPSREVTFVVPYPPGGNSDNLARLFADRLRIKLGVPIVIENRPGGTTSLGTSIVGRAKPDGYTLLLATSKHRLYRAALYTRRAL